MGSRGRWGREERRAALRAQATKTGTAPHAGSSLQRRPGWERLSGQVGSRASVALSAGHPPPLPPPSSPKPTPLPGRQPCCPLCLLLGAAGWWKLPQAGSSLLPLFRRAFASPAPHRLPPPPPSPRAFITPGSVTPSGPPSSPQELSPPQDPSSPKSQPPPRTLHPAPGTDPKPPGSIPRGTPALPQDLPSS